jgi:small-conductance mechanosensitive channel
MRPPRAEAALLALVLAAFPALALNDGLDPLPTPVDRSTPLACAHGFLAAAHDGDYRTAAHYLDLDWLPRPHQAEVGPMLARRFRFVLDRKLYQDPSATVANGFTALAKGTDENARNALLGSIPIGNVAQPIRLDRREVAGQRVWVFSADTVRSIDKLYDEYGPPFGDALPEAFFERSYQTLELWQWLGLIAVLAVATIGAIVAQRVLLWLGIRLAKVTSITWDDQLVAAGRGPLMLPLWALTVAAGTRALLIPPPTQRTFDVIVKSLLIASLVWYLLRVLRVMAVHLETAVGAEGGRARSVRTQIAVLRRVFEIAIWVIGSALVLMQFEIVRNVGVSMLASAGIAGLVFGLAAQKSIATLLAGIQLSITQPVRIGDTVVVEGQFGTVEEIKLTYVVIRVWDLRRLVVPITQFLEKPFENWSRGSTDILGQVTLEVDFSADVDAFRAEVKRLLEGDGKELWDGKTCDVAVTATTERTQTVRVLVSASDPGKNGDLRNILRERLVRFLQKRPEWMPTRRSRAA